MLFNKENKGGEELQAITGIFSAESSYSVIGPEIDDAMRTVSQAVSAEVLAEAEQAYENGDNDKRALVRAVQLPVAVLAILRLSKTNLVAHDDRGAKFKVDGDEKMPFEWMIDRDERAMTERYYRAMDALYDFLLSSHNESFANFINKHSLFFSIVKTLSDFERVYPIEGSYYVFYMLQNLVVECQGRTKKLVGEEIWAELFDTKNEELLKVCQRHAILSAIVTAVERWSLEVFPLSIARRFAPSYQGNRSSNSATESEMLAYIKRMNSQIAASESEISTLLSGGKNPWEQMEPVPEGDPRNKYYSVQ